MRTQRWKQAGRFHAGKAATRGETPVCTCHCLAYWPSASAAAASSWPSASAIIRLPRIMAAGGCLNTAHTGSAPHQPRTSRSAHLPGSAAPPSAAPWCRLPACRPSAPAAAAHCATAPPCKQGGAGATPFDARHVAQGGRTWREEALAPSQLPLRQYTQPLSSCHLRSGTAQTNQNMYCCAAAHAAGATLPSPLTLPG